MEELKSLRIVTFEEIPSSEVFVSQIEAKNVPTVFKGCVKNWKASSTWNPSTGGLDYLLERAGSCVAEAMLSKSAPVFYGDLRSHERVPVPFSAFIELCRKYSQTKESHQSLCCEAERCKPEMSHAEPCNPLISDCPQQIYLAQVPIVNHENGERAQLESLRHDITTQPLFLDAKVISSINLWMNIAQSRSSTHYDPHHNLLCVVSGCKQVTLWPPSASPLLYPMPIYGEASNHSSVSLENPDFSIHPRSHCAVEHSQKCILHEGDALFIPEGWFHQVDSNDLTIAVNFWWTSNTMSNMLEHMDAYYLRRILRRLIDKEMNAMLHTSSVSASEHLRNEAYGLSIKADSHISSVEQKTEGQCSTIDRLDHNNSLHDLGQEVLWGLHELISLVHQSVNITSQAQPCASVNDPEVSPYMECQNGVSDLYNMDDDPVARILWSLGPLTLRDVFLFMVHNFPRTLEALILHRLSPVGAEVLTRKFDEMDQQLAEEERGKFYAIFYGVFDDQLSPMETILNGKESFARKREVSAAGLANEVGSSIDNAATPGRLVPLPDLNASDDASPGDADDEPPSANDICDEEEDDSECTPDGKGPKVRSLSELLAVKEDGIIEQAGKGIVSHVVDSSSMDFPGDVSVSKICGSSSKRKKKKNNDLDEEYKPLEVKGSSSIHGTKKARTVDTEPQRTHQTVELSDSELDQDVSHPTVGTKRRAKHTLDGESNPEKKTKKIKHSDEENHMISKNPSLQDPEGGAPRLSTGSWINQYLRPSVPAERDSASSVITTRTFQDGKVPTSLVSWNDWQGGTSSVTVSDAQLRQLSTFDSSVQISQNSSVRTPTHQFPMHCFTAGNYSAPMRPVAAVRDYVGHDQGIQERPNARGKEKSAPQLGAGTPLVHHGTSPAVHHRVQIDINALPMEDKGLEQEVVEMMAQNQYERMQGDVGVGPSRMLHLQQHQHPGNTPYNRENGINGGFTMRQKEIIHVAELGRVNVGSTVGHPKENPPSIRLGVSGQRQQNPPLSAFGPTPSNWNSNMQRQGGSHNYLWGMDHIDKYNPAERERSLLWPHMMVSRLPVGNGEHHIQNSAQKGKSKQGSKQQSTLLDFSGVGLGKQNTNFSRSPNINQPESSGVAAAAAKRKGTVGPVNLYSNDTIPAMQLLDLMHNGGMQSKVGTPYRVPRNSEPFVRNSSFHPGSEAHRTGSPNPRVPSVVHDSQASRVNLQEKGCTTCTSALSIVSSFASAFQNMNAGYNAAERNSGCLASGPLVIQDQQWNVNSSHDARSQRFRLSPGMDSGRRNHQLVAAQQDGRVIAGTTTFSKGKGMAGAITSGKGKAIAGPSIAVCPPPTPLAILNPANMVGSGSQQGKRRSLPTPNTNNCVLNRNPAEFTDYNLVKSYMRGPDDFKGKRKSKLERPPRPKIVGRRPNKKQPDDAGSSRDKYPEGQQK